MTSCTHIDIGILLQDLKEPVQGGSHRMCPKGFHVPYQLADGIFGRGFLRHVSYLGQHVVHFTDAVEVDEPVVRRRSKESLKARRRDDAVSAIDPFELDAT